MNAYVNQLFDLSDRVAAVTGAGSGLGRAMSLGLAKAGARVAVSDINLLSAQATVDLIQAAGGQASAFRCDTRSQAEIAAWFAASDAAFGRLDILVNNA